MHVHNMRLTANCVPVAGCPQNDDHRPHSSWAGGMRVLIWSGDESPVKVLRHGRRCVHVGEDPKVGGRRIRGNRRPFQGGQDGTGLQRHKKIRRGAEYDGRGVGRSGDVGKYGGGRRWQYAATTIECKSAPTWAIALPSIVELAFIVTDAYAIMVPSKTEDVPRVAELPTCQKMFLACAPPLRMT